MSPAAFGVEVAKGEEETNANVEFCDVPVDAHCPYCRQSVVTHVEYRSSWLTWLLSFIVCILLGWIAFCVLPFVWPLLQDSCHHCSQCSNLLSRKHRIRLPAVQNQVVTVRCGSCAIVLSLRWALLVAFMFFCVGVAYLGRYYVKYIGIGDIPRGPPSPLSWNDYLSQCGIRTYLGNPLHAVHSFEKEFRHKTVSWEGRLIRVSEGIFSKHFMYLRMTPAQYPGPGGIDRPDLGLLFGKELTEKVADLDMGDLLSFDATLIALAKRGQPHFGVLWDMSIVVKGKFLPNLDAERGFFYIGRMGLAPIHHLPVLAKKIQRAAISEGATAPTIMVKNPLISAEDGKNATEAHPVVAAGAAVIDVAATDAPSSITDRPDQKEPAKASKKIPPEANIPPENQPVKAKKKPREAKGPNTGNNDAANNP